MGKTKTKLFISASLVVFSIFTILIFQNCSKTNFGQAASASPPVIKMACDNSKKPADQQRQLACPSGSGIVRQTSTPECNANGLWVEGGWLPNPVDFSSCACPANTVLINNQCVPDGKQGGCSEDQYLNSANQCVEFQCNRYVELVAEPVVVPARTFSSSSAGGVGGVCYYKKIFNPIANSPSSLTGIRLTSVVGHDHDQWLVGNNDPYLMASKDFLLTLQGKRSVKLSSDATTLKESIVDNFILVRFNNDQQIFAYGSVESAILGTNYITFNGRRITMDSSGFSGVRFSIKPLDFTIQFPVNVQKQFSIQAIDNGSIRELSNVYMVFQ